jgi:hypothetical protein
MFLMISRMLLRMTDNILLFLLHLGCHQVGGNKADIKLVFCSYFLNVWAGGFVIQTVTQYIA